MCQETPVLACNFAAIDTSKQAAHKQLSGYLMSEGFTEKRELPDGYALRYKAGDLMKVAQYVKNERLCCPFLDFEIHTRAAEGAVWLHLRGQGEVKAFLDTAGEVPMRGTGQVKVSELGHA